MQVSWRRERDYTILSVQDRVGAMSSAAELRPHLQEAYKAGCKRIALEFTKESVLPSRFLPLLVEFSKKLSGKSGTLAVIASNGQMLEMLRLFDADGMLKAVRNARELFAGAPLL